MAMEWLSPACVKERKGPTLYSNEKFWNKPNIYVCNELDPIKINREPIIVTHWLRML